MRPWAFAAFAALALLFQLYLPLFFESASGVDLPLLVLLYLAVLRRRPIFGTLLGAAIGLLQDALSQHPLGLFGIAKTVIGYAAASLSWRLDTDGAAVRFVLAGLVYLVHQGCYWGMRVLLLGHALAVDPARTLLLAAVNAAIGIPLFLLFDRLRSEDE
ncbi:MAG: rod shape-determining protein MreD [Bryobacteraceae bacterium]|nr:rod shape-determining protein MreD [Bryobacteraceae bacterium]